MKKIAIIPFVLTCLLFNTNLFAQFAGGNGSGYASSQSATIQILPPLYNDMQLLTIQEPSDNQVLNVNTSYTLSFHIANLGIYPITPNDSVFFEVKLDNVILLDSFFNTAIEIFQFETYLFTMPNALTFADTTDFVSFCVTLKGTSFAADSVALNNTACNTIKVIDPSGISNIDKDKTYIFYNNTTKTIVVQTSEKIISISLYNVLGREVSFFLQPISNEAFMIKPENIYPQILLLKVNGFNNVFSKKLFVY